MALFMKRKSNLIRRVQIGLTGALAFCLCMIIMIFVFQPAASGEGTPAWCGPGSWKGTAYANVFGSKVFYSIHLTLHEDGSGTLTLICDGTEMSYRMKKASTNPYDMYYIDRKDYPDDPLEDIGSVFKGNTFSFIFHNYQDADNPGWLKDGNIILLPLSCWEKPYASVSEGYHAKETVLYPIGLTMDKELIQAEYNNYDGKDYTVVRFALEESQSVWTIEDEIAEYIYLRKQDDRLQKHTEIIYPGGRGSSQSYSTFDLLFYGSSMSEALICYDRAYDLDTLEEITDVLVEDNTDQGRIERLYTELKDNKLTELKGTPETHGKLLIVIPKPNGKLYYSAPETSSYFQGYYGIPLELLAENYDEADQIIFVLEEKTSIGRYYSYSGIAGGSAKRTTTLIVIVDLAQNAVYEPIIAAVDDPPENIAGSTASGEFKIQDAMDMILQMYQK